MPDDASLVIKLLTASNEKLLEICSSLEAYCSGLGIELGKANLEITMLNEEIERKNDLLEQWAAQVRNER